MEEQNNKKIQDLLTKWDSELIDLERTLHEAIEKSRKRIYDLKLRFAKEAQVEPQGIPEEAEI